MLPSIGVVDHVTSGSIDFRDTGGRHFTLSLAPSPQLTDRQTAAVTPLRWRHAAIFLEQLAYLIHREADLEALAALREAIASGGPIS